MDITTGKLVSYSSPTIVDDIIYVGSDNNVYALNSHNGAVIWTYTTDSSGYSYPVSSPALFGGVVYVGSYDYNVYALNASNGHKLWNYTTGFVLAA
jgi:eukaryotic-like serine/threonine-protein kinase